MEGDLEENINSEDSDQEPAPNSPLGSVFGFFMAIYAIIYTGLNYGVGKVLNSYDNQGNLKEGLFWV